jgi:hypothetical protein
MGPHDRILPEVPGRLTRRTILSAFAPPAPIAWRGEPIAAAYVGRLRQTHIWIRREDSIWTGLFDHDRSLVSLPVRADGLPDYAPPKPRIRLRMEGQWLVAADDRRVLRRLMPVGPAGTPNIIYPANAHPDLTAIWALDGFLFFTNNDYHNVYQLPDSMNSAWQKPLRR